MIEKIFLLHAHAQSGKDTCAALMKEEYEKMGKKVIIISFADYVKFVLTKYYGIEDFKSVIGRTTIQQFATEQVRYHDPTFWARTVADLLNAIDKDYSIAIIPDWRFHNEYSVMAARFSHEIVVPILITRPNVEEVDNLTTSQREHQSETELDDFRNFKYTIYNHQGKLEQTREQLIYLIKEEQQYDKNNVKLRPF